MRAIREAKDQRDEHIRRYAELLEARAAIPVVQNEPVEIGYGKPPPRPKGLARQIAEETGLSVATVRCADRNTTGSSSERHTLSLESLAQRIKRLGIDLPAPFVTRHGNAMHSRRIGEV